MAWTKQGSIKGPAGESGSSAPCFTVVSVNDSSPCLSTRGPVIEQLTEVVDYLFDSDQWSNQTSHTVESMEWQFDSEEDASTAAALLKDEMFYLGRRGYGGENLATINKISQYKNTLTLTISGSPSPKTRWQTISFYWLNTQSLSVSDMEVRVEDLLDHKVSQADCVAYCNTHGFSCVFDADDKPTITRQTDPPETNGPSA